MVYTLPFKEVLTMAHVGMARNGEAQSGLVAGRLARLPNDTRAQVQARAVIAERGFKGTTDVHRGYIRATIRSNARWCG